MATFLLVWNPKRWHWDDIKEMSQLVQSGKLVTARWSCGNSKRLQNGDRVFLIKLGQKPKGIFASGSVVQGSYEDLHWDNEKASFGETAMFVNVRFDTLLKPENNNILLRHLLDTGPFVVMHWNTQMSGVQIPDSIASELEKVWESFASSQSFLSPEEIPENNTHYEGAVQQVTVNAYERNAKARKDCVEHYGASCFVCGFDFGKVFGKLGDGFIHVHHLRPLSEIKEEYQVDPIDDLRPICPNCHAMIHRRSPPLSIEQIQAILSSSNVQPAT
jgi:5-methylcytosine-specific restriction protein A